MASNAELYFKKITSPECGYDYIATYPERKQRESEWLDFKAADRIDDKSIRENWSKALSGFANTEGGVLIWGIDARRDKDSGIDCASALALAPDADLLAQKLIDLLLDAVSLALIGVQVRSFKKPGGKEGFVVCLVPEGSHKAHSRHVRFLNGIGRPMAIQNSHSHSSIEPANQSRIGGFYRQGK
jgi:predicted HTH transcriptional regulator